MRVDRAPVRELFPLCADTGVGFTAFSPLAGGWLTGKYSASNGYPEGSRITLRPYRHLEHEEIFRALASLADDARTRGVEMSSLALAWVRHHPRVNAAIIGPATARTSLPPDRSSPARRPTSRGWVHFPGARLTAFYARS